MIFAFLQPFEQPSDWAYVGHIKEVILRINKDTEFRYAELIAPQEVRLRRNVVDPGYAPPKPDESDSPQTGDYGMT